MIAILRSTSFYFCFPLFFTTSLLFIVFNLPPHYYAGALFLPIVTFLIFIPSFFITSHFPKKDIFYSINKLKLSSSSFKYVANAYALFLLFFCVVDLSVNGLKILHPESYADFSSVGMHVRHISNMVWTLVPIAYFCVSRAWVRKTLVASAVIFPILFMDRNRLIQVFYCLTILFILSREGKPIIWIKVLMSILCVLIVFVFLGFAKSSDSAFVINNLGSDVSGNVYPLSHWFELLPSAMQQICLYITTPLFNFSTIFEIGYRDTTSFYSQLFPFLLNNDAAVKEAPIWIQRFNIGTEFYPFLLAGGLWFVLLMLIVAIVMLQVSKMAFQRYPNIFTLLIFLRISYCALMIGFGPQMFIYTNIGFIVVCFGLWILSTHSGYFLRLLKYSLRTH